MNRTSRTRFRPALLAMVAAGALIAPHVVYAQSAGGTSAEATYAFDIPAQPVAGALNAIAGRAGLQVIYPDKEPLTINAPAVRGTMTASQALATALSGSGYTFRYLRDGVVTLVSLRDGADGGERVLGAVRVEGAQGATSSLAGASPVNGVNGSRDVTATEGTGSYTSNALTIGSKTAQSIKDSPVTVSVLTSQQLKDQNITDLNGAMRNLPGVTVTHDGAGSATDLAFYSRGFRITQFSFDGGAAMTADPTRSYRPIVDLSLYDHIELLRGAAGTFNGYGDPGGVINLVRKKPLDHSQMLLDMQLGSWDWHRVMADITGPLGFGGKLRGRLIATHQDNRFFYDTAKYKLDVVSGTLEYDLTPTTLFSVGMDYQVKKELPFQGGLMRYQDGRSLRLPRSTCFCFQFAFADATNKEFFGQIEQRIGSNWTLKVKATRINQLGKELRPSVNGTINPFTLIGANANTDRYIENHDKQTMLEATIDGSFRLFGQEQKVVVGANYSMEDTSGTFAKLGYNLTPFEFFSFPGRVNNSVNVFDFDTYDWNKPVYGEINQTKILTDDHRYLNAYANLEFTPFKRLHIDVGLRYAASRSRGLAKDACWEYLTTDSTSPCYGKSIGELVKYNTGSLINGGKFSWPPSILWKYDLTNNLTASAIYTDIYIDQSSLLDRNRRPLPPQVGGNFEGALKWASTDRRFNATLSGYYTRKKNVNTIQDCDASGAPACSFSSGAVGQLSTTFSCCYLVDPTRRDISYGVDLELAGEVRKGWQLSASYNFNRTLQKGANLLFDGERQPLLSVAPRHKAQLWTTYTFLDGSRLAGLVLGFGARAQSRTFVSDRFCKAFVPASVNPSQPCQSGQSVPVFFSDPGHVIFSGSIGYKVNDNLQFDVQAENLLDKTYYEQVGGIYGGNWYGSPRSVKVTLRGKW